MQTFGKDFYPTPIDVINQMLLDLDLEGKYVLEPSSGKGDILDDLKIRGAKTIACEKNENLATISKSKCDRFLKNDFLQVTREEISHVSYIVMNPPFSADEKHILHAWDVAPDGCEIIALCNSETLFNSFSSYRKKLDQITKEHGTNQNLGDCFSTAERKTDVNISLIHLYKPSRESEDEFSGYFDIEEEHEHQEYGIMQHDEIREIVNRYVGAVKMFNEVIEKNKQINNIISPIGNGDISFGAYERRGRELYPINREEFKKSLQKNAWKYIFGKMNMSKYVTSSLMSDINKFIEQQQNIPFTRKNVYKMLEVIVGTQQQRMERVIEEAFDKITQYYKDNRYYHEGWKTNDHWMVNKKFILPWIIEMDWGGKMGTKYSSNGNTMDDIHKALCYVTGTKFGDTESWYNWMNNYQDVEVTRKYRDEDTGEVKEYTTKENKIIQRDFGVWYDWGFFRIKGFKKGTLHVQFKDDNVWEQFNIMACKLKGWELPYSTTHDFRKKEKGVEIYE